MFSFLARVTGLFFLVIALVTAVMDITKSIGASAFVFTSLGETWTNLGPSSLETIRNQVHPLVWDPVISWFLLWPTWLIFVILAFALLAIGRRRRRKPGRFATR